MDNLRKTIAYKVCGYSFYVLLVFIIFCVIAVVYEIKNCEGLMFLSCAGAVALIYYLVVFAIAIIVPLCFICLSITAFITRKSNNGKKCIYADIGYVLMIALSCFSCYIWTIQNVREELSSMLSIFGGK